MDVYALAPVSEDRSRFGSSCWAWRPIHLISELSISVFRLPLSTKGWEENSGFGLSNQSDCDMLADAIDGFLVLNKNNAFEDSDRIYVCCGSWIDQFNVFIPINERHGLNKEYPVGTVLYSGVVSDEGRLVYPAYSVSISRIREFVSFLRGCGGFEIL